ncbi:MAG: hypothetical protein NVSMB64_30660 [Candidatus Velthaea sp.]
MKALMSEGLSERAACRLADCPRRTFQYRLQRADDPRIVERMRALAAERPRFGWRRINVLLQREGIVLNHKRLRRIYRREQLQVRARKKRHVCYVRGSLVKPGTRPNERRSPDFVHDTLANGRQIRVLTLMDDFTREALAVGVDFMLPTLRVLRIFDAIGGERGLPETIRFDHGPQFTSIAMLRWGAEHRLRRHFIDPGKPTQNGQESFNGRVRDELLNPNCFANVHEARSAAENWLIDYNELRPHSALGYQTPREFITAFQQSTHQLAAA